MTFLNPVFIISILIALSVHEAAHALAAYWLGDSTAKSEGRLTLNPIAHIDLLGALLFVTVGFGWGKPVPVDPRNFRHPKRDNALTALAGPVSNLLLAFLCFLALVLVGNPETSSAALLETPSVSQASMKFLLQLLESSLFLNLGLMAFNLLPIAPLDGSKIVEPFVPLRYEDQFSMFMQRGPYILLGLLLAERLLNFPFLSMWIEWLMDGVLGAFMLIVGVFV